MKTIIHRISPLQNIWFLFLMMLIVALLIAASPVFAQAAPASTETTAAMDTAKSTDPRNLFDVSFGTAEEAVNQALTEKGVGDKVASQINGRNNKPIFSYNKPLTVEARGVTYNQQNNHFEANLVFLDGSDVISALPASGHFDQMIEIAVLKHEIRGGDIIRDADIQIRDYPINRVHAGTITDFSGLIGKAPLRNISPFRPIMANEVASPAVVKKDALVQMHYNLPGMQIATSGQVITPGAKGDVVSVRNTASKKIIQAVVTDSENVNALMTGVDHAQAQ